MIIVDRALERREEEGKPLRVGMVGAGFMARGIALQLCRATPGMELVAIANRHVEGAVRAYGEAGVENPQIVTTSSEMESAIGAGIPAVTDDALVLCGAGQIDVVVEVTGAVEFGAQVALSAFDNGKHLVAMNAELDGTVGPILKTHADRAGVVFTSADGDQPGVIMNLYRFVRGIGVRPVLCGNIKGLHDPYRNPTTQEAFAKKWGQKPHMVTSFADGTKISFEQAIVANGTGMRVAKRGMHGPHAGGAPIENAADWFPAEDLLEGEGIVDYVVDAKPGPGVFVIGTHDHPAQMHYLNLYKLGQGPFYVFYTPYHLCHFEVHNTIARAALFADPCLAPLNGPKVDVIATAKKDLTAGEILDGIGHYMTYGQCENSSLTFADGLLPVGLAEGCRLLRDVKRDQVLTYADVALPDGRLVDRLRDEQNRRFFE